MKNLFLSLFALFFISGCAQKIDKQLIGTWKSNREKTVAEYFRRFPDRFANEPERKKKFIEIFGHTTHSYTRDELTVDYKGDVFTEGYSITGRGEDYVVVKPHSECIGEDFIKVRFVDNYESYWVSEDSDFSEMFSKIK